MLELNDNQYEVQGIALTELASRYELPLYVYDADTMKRQYDRQSYIYPKPFKWHPTTAKRIFILVC